MEITVDSETLFEAYEAAENEQAKAVLRSALTTAEPNRTEPREWGTLYPETDAEQHLPATIDEWLGDESDTHARGAEAMGYLDPQFGQKVVEPTDTANGDLYVAEYSPISKMEDVDVPDGWTWDVREAGGEVAGINFYAPE